MYAYSVTDNIWFMVVDFLKLLYIYIYIQYIIKYGTVVLNSRDQQGNVWLLYKTHLDK